MNEKYRPKRGEVYYIRYDTSVGSEESIGRPAVVVSSEIGNVTGQTYNCVFITTMQKNLCINVPLTSTRRASYALCNQISTFDIRRFGDRMCVLTGEEMARVDEGVATALGLTLHDSQTEQQLTEKYEAEIAALKAAHEKELAAAKSEAAGMIVECEMHKRLYGMAMDRLTATVFGRDLTQKFAEDVPEEPELVEDEESEVEESGLVDINRCGLSELTALGFSTAVAKMIIAARPYMDTDDLRGVPGVTRIGYQLVAKKITVGDTAEFRKPKQKPKPQPKAEKPVAEKPKVESGKVNVNTATYRELVSFAGINETTAKKIVGYRNKHGKFTVLEELLAVPRFGKVCLAKYRDKLEV